MRLRSWQTLGVFSVCYGALLILHATLLRLPYFWDELGYYVPAARDILLRGSLIPLSTVSNAHPPLVMLWLAAAWKIFGFSPFVTRTAMLAVAALALTGLYRLAEKAANPTVALYTTALTAIYPVFFAQSSLGHVDLAAAGLTFWGLAAYLDGRPRAVAFWFCLAVLAKEEALLTPAVLGLWEILGSLVRLSSSRSGATSSLPWRQSTSERLWLRRADPTGAHDNVVWMLAALASPLIPLSLWYAYHFSQTGYVLGNPEFVRYNVTATMSVVRVGLAMILRLWQAFGYMHLWLLTIAMVVAMWMTPLRDRGIERRRIPIPVQMIMLVVVMAYVLAMSVVGGAVLARYMLTATPLVILAAVSTIRRRTRWWPAVLLAVGISFVTAWWWNPPYGFAPEDNLAYRDFVVLHQDAARYLDAHARDRRVLTAWPASDELMRPWLGYVSQPIRVERIENFSDAGISAATSLRDTYDLALVFSTKYQVAHSLTVEWPAWARQNARYFDYHRDLMPSEAAERIGGKIVFQEYRNGLWVAVIAVDHAEYAGMPSEQHERSGSHHVARVGLDDQPHVPSRSQAQVIAGGESQQDFERRAAAVNDGPHGDVALLQ